MMHLPTTAHGVLQPGRRDGWRRAGHGNARGGVDDGNGVAAAGGRGLVDLHARMLRLVAGGDEGGRGRVEREARGNGLGLLRGRGFGRVAGEGGALRSAGDGDQLIPMPPSQNSCGLKGGMPAGNSRRSRSTGQGRTQGHLPGQKSGQPQTCCGRR
jgi:hypothetical protein